MDGPYQRCCCHSILYLGCPYDSACCCCSGRIGRWKRNSCYQSVGGPASQCQGAATETTPALEIDKAAIEKARRSFAFRESATSEARTSLSVNVQRSKALLTLVPQKMCRERQAKKSYVSGCSRTNCGSRSGFSESVVREHLAVNLSRKRVHNQFYKKQQLQHLQHHSKQNQQKFHSKNSTCSFRRKKKTLTRNMWRSDCQLLLLLLMVSALLLCGECTLPSWTTTKTDVVTDVHNTDAADAASDVHTAVSSLPNTGLISPTPARSAPDSATARRELAAAAARPAVWAAQTTRPAAAGSPTIFADTEQTAAPNLLPPAAVILTEPLHSENTVLPKVPLPCDDNAAAEVHSAPAAIPTTTLLAGSSAAIDHTHSAAFASNDNRDAASFTGRVPSKRSFPGVSLKPATAAAALSTVPGAAPSSAATLGAAPSSALSSHPSTATPTTRCHTASARLFHTQNPPPPASTPVAAAVTAASSSTSSSSSSSSFSSSPPSPRLSPSSRSLSPPRLSATPTEAAAAAGVDFVAPASAVLSLSSSASSFSPSFSVFPPTSPPPGVPPHMSKPIRTTTESGASYQSLTAEYSIKLEMINGRAATRQVSVGKQNLLLALDSLTEGLRLFNSHSTACTYTPSDDEGEEDREHQQRKQPGDEEEAQQQDKNFSGEHLLLANSKDAAKYLQQLSGGASFKLQQFKGTGQQMLQIQQQQVQQQQVQQQQVQQQQVQQQQVQELVGKKQLEMKKPEGERLLQWEEGKQQGRSVGGGDAGVVHLEADDGVSSDEVLSTAGVEVTLGKKKKQKQKKKRKKKKGTREGRGKWSPRAGDGQCYDMTLSRAAMFCTDKRQNKPFCSFLSDTPFECGVDAAPDLQEASLYAQRSDGVRVFERRIEAFDLVSLDLQPSSESASPSSFQAVVPAAAEKNDTVATAAARQGEQLLPTKLVVERSSQIYDAYAGVQGVWGLAGPEFCCRNFSLWSSTLQHLQISSFAFDLNFPYIDSHTQQRQQQQEEEQNAQQQQKKHHRRNPAATAPPSFLHLGVLEEVPAGALLAQQQRKKSTEATEIGKSRSQSGESVYLKGFSFYDSQGNLLHAESRTSSDSPEERKNSFKRKTVEKNDGPLLQITHQLQQPNTGVEEKQQSRPEMQQQQQQDEPDWPGEAKQNIKVDEVFWAERIQTGSVWSDAIPHFSTYDWQLCGVSLAGPANIGDWTVVLDLSSECLVLPRPLWASLQAWLSPVLDVKSTQCSPLDSSNSNSEGDKAGTAAARPTVFPEQFSIFSDSVAELHDSAAAFKFDDAIQLADNATAALFPSQTAAAAANRTTLAAAEAAVAKTGAEEKTAGAALPLRRASKKGEIFTGAIHRLTCPLFPYLSTTAAFDPKQETAAPAVPPKRAETSSSSTKKSKRPRPPLPMLSFALRAPVEDLDTPLEAAQPKHRGHQQIHQPLDALHSAADSTTASQQQPLSPLPTKKGPLTGASVSYSSFLPSWLFSHYGHKEEAAATESQQQRLMVAQKSALHALPKTQTASSKQSQNHQLSPQQQPLESSPETVSSLNAPTAAAHTEATMNGATEPTATTTAAAAQTFVPEWTTMNIAAESAPPDAMPKAAVDSAFGGQTEKRGEKRQRLELPLENLVIYESEQQKESGSSGRFDVEDDEKKVESLCVVPQPYSFFSKEGRIIRFGTRALAAFYVIVDQKRWRIGLLPKVGNIPFPSSNEGCAAKPHCRGEQLYVPATNECIDPDCSNWLFFVLNDEKKTCELAGWVAPAAGTAIVLLVSLEAFILVLRTRLLLRSSAQT